MLIERRFFIVILYRTSAYARRTSVAILAQVILAINRVSALHRTRSRSVPYDGTQSSSCHCKGKGKGPSARAADAESEGQGKGESARSEASRSSRCSHSPSSWSYRLITSMSKSSAHYGRSWMAPCSASSQFAKCVAHRYLPGAPRHAAAGDMDGHNLAHAVAVRFRDYRSFSSGE